MRAVLSIVIPTLNAQEALPVVLSSLMEGLEAGLVRELIVSDGGSRDATRQIADEVGAIIVAGSASRGGQLRRGAGIAQGAWLLFLHADTQLPEGWSATVKAQIAQGQPAYFGLRFGSDEVVARLVAGWANLRSRLFHLPYGDQGLLISRIDYDAVGGFPDIPLMEDVAIARCLGRRLMRMPGHVTTSAARFERDGWLLRGGRNLLLLVRYLCGANPHDLRRRY
ncbi:TIGR04283 family arsenosugar biosynthesis glycosyltransferase [Roseovarius pelagicus]|uniref:TIGR04283 family arsenosugar biosynthesis glycosyltransferase n=1 Tax=Roseovarius pelagicus TaxID=2980108 RepID=A0ABY6DCH2_9RHOB|nr:TIGR04283 family arsenosugar biosynthesis glycosyltransferase [Roseovarius pelagicus]UXX82708.1 TIGR04283 family arsenosugar biosynthesis glycosyltransferase [Roseovarius pelagicus]